ncbi:MAG: T9SS type A sorting domain-containing protein, partial [Olleya sp.]
SFDSSNGDLWIADVGQSGYEEINKSVGSGSAGDNYGWRCFEGLHDFNNESSCPPMSATKTPVSEYVYGNGPNGFRCSITGGYVYRGTTYPNFVGKYFFADYCSGEIGILTDNAGTWSMSWQVPNINWSWVSFGEDNNGELYIVGGNAVYKISDPNLSVDTFTNRSFNMYPNPANEEVNFVFNTDNNLETIILYNAQGKKVKTIYPEQTNTVSVSVKNLPKGFYLVKLTDKNLNTTVKKLIIN